MSDMVTLVARFGFPTVAAAAFFYILLRGELHFRYPRAGAGSINLNQSIAEKALDDPKKKRPRLLS